MRVSIRVRSEKNDLRYTKGTNARIQNGSYQPVRDDACYRTMATGVKWAVNMSMSVPYA